ncbi:hypothetical protein FRC10_001958 [Ceratobasidium sp. 414]|nr:hypothetical protein FRC10_001958 [Ceratobasidium sp. 414]
MKPLPNADVLLHVVYHVFLPPKLPQAALGEDTQSQIDLRLLGLILGAIEEYRMLASHDVRRWTDMCHVLALHIREQNAAVLVRKNAADTTFENFEVEAPNVAIMSGPGKLIRHFPGPAVRIPNSVFYDQGFIQETSNFLVQMSADVLEGSSAKTTKAGSTVSEVRDSADPHYISQLFVAILRGVGEEFEPNQVVKRIADEVLWSDAYLPWRRSPLWLIIRVALQTSLPSTEEYKHFMVFVHAHILDLCHDNPAFSSDLLFVMRAKLARRLLKAQDSVPEFLVRVVGDITTRTEEVLQSRWAEIQNRAAEAPPLHVDPEAAIIQSVPNTQQHLKRILGARPTLAQPRPFVPNKILRFLDHSDFVALHNNNVLRDAFAADKHIALFDFESTVFNNLSGWIGNNLHSEFASTVIDSCLEQYTLAALPFYTQDAADRSIMILTIMALWVALDRLATAQHPLLLDYSPEIPENILDVLLLRSSQHLEQARNIQLYLRRRYADSKAARYSVFAETNTASSFSVRFFDQSPSLQALKQTIEQDAQRKRDKKLQEMHLKNDEHARITRQTQDMVCACLPKVKGRSRKRCEKCRMQQQANKMHIDVHEWPLPAKELDAKAVVFELGCPDAFNYWRSATYYILCDLGHPSRERATVQCTLAGYGDLTPWSAHLKRPVHRITLASSTKPFIRSHYKKPKIPANQSTVCVKNGLAFEFFDLTQQAWAGGPFPKTNFAYFGTLVLPAESPYQHLGYALEGTSHTSNQVLADQSHCPQSISLHEHYAFGTLRSGPRLQWMNIVRGLEENCLSFNRVEVDLLHTQAAWQVGPLLPDNQFRDWHLELDDPQFGRLLVAQALRALNRVKGSWIESTSVRTIVMLVTRLLASTTDTSTQQDAYQLLREARGVTFKWLQELSTKLQAVELPAQVSDYQQRICEMAAICRSTYDVDALHIPELFTTAEDYHVVIFCSVILHDNRPLELDNLPSSLQVLICRDRRLAHKIAPTVTKALTCMPWLPDGAVSQYWNSYRPSSSGWAVDPGSNSRWVSTVTENMAGRSSHHVHLNLLEGRLLVDGKPLGRLPKDYVAHPTYVRLLGQADIDLYGTTRDRKY